MSRIRLRFSWLGLWCIYRKLDEKPTVASGLPVHFGYIFLYWFILVNWANNNRSGLAYFIFASNIVNLNLLGLYHILELVGGFKHFLFSIIYGIILPIDELIFFKMVIAPPTRELLSLCGCSVSILPSSDWGVSNLSSAIPISSTESRLSSRSISAWNFPSLVG